MKMRIVLGLLLFVVVLAWVVILDESDAPRSAAPSTEQSLKF